jgi:hypothetical protein
MHAIGIACDRDRTNDMPIGEGSPPDKTTVMNTRESFTYMVLCISASLE